MADPKQKKASSDDPTLRWLERLVGTWSTEMTHPQIPGTAKGTVEVSWLPGERFLIHDNHVDHPDFPDGHSVIGDMGNDSVGPDAPATAPKWQMHYYDERGVHRSYDMRAEGDTWHLTREDPSFPQRFAGTFEGNDTLKGQWQLKEGGQWKDDAAIIYRRR